LDPAFSYRAVNITCAMSGLAPGALRALARLEAERSPVLLGRAGR
jgi:hypothetical protein